MTRTPRVETNRRRGKRREEDEGQKQTTSRARQNRCDRAARREMTRRRTPSSTTTTTKYPRGSRVCNSPRSVYEKLPRSFWASLKVGIGKKSRGGRYQPKRVARRGAIFSPLFLLLPLRRRRRRVKERRVRRYRTCDT